MAEEKQEQTIVESNSSDVLERVLEEQGEIDNQTLEMLKNAAIDVVKEKVPDIEEIIDQLKEKHGTSNVYMYIFDENEFYIFRAMKRFEFKKIKSMKLSDFEEEDYIFNTCVLYPENLKTDELKGGSVRTIVELIYYYSNFGSSSPVVEL